MKVLEKNFKLNGKQYILLDRNENVGLFGLKNEYSNNFSSYEVSRIYQNKQKIIFGNLIEESETITSNSKFGIDGSGCYPNLERSKIEYHLLTKKIKENETKRIKS